MKGNTDITIWPNLQVGQDRVLEDWGIVTGKTIIVTAYATQAIR